MSFFSADFLCLNPDCGIRFNLIIPRAERGKPHLCTACGAPGDPTIAAPMVARASLPDGTKRHDLRRLHEAAQIEAASFDLPVAERKHHEKAISDLTKSGAKT